MTANLTQPLTGRDLAKCRYPLFPLLIASLLLLSPMGHAQDLDCTQATVVESAQLSGPATEAIKMLTEEVSKRTGQLWSRAHRFPEQGTGCVVVAATRTQIAQLLPPALALMALQPPDHAEAFSMRSLHYHRRPVVLIEGKDDRGLLFGVGALLRKLSLSADQALLPDSLRLQEVPEKPIRSHQLGYRFKNNTYDAWTLAQFEQQIRDLAIFGGNSVQLIAPASDDERLSPLFPAPPLETLLGISRILDRYGLNCDIYYPEMEADYSRPADVFRELARFEELFRQIPRVDALWIPGGDPGHTPPALLFPLIAQEAALLHRYHPQARIYVSAQGMDAQQYEDFYRLVAQHPAWLAGVFFGPQSRDSFETQRRRLPADLPLLFYPDIGHTMHAQFPVPQWDPVFALTEGREPIDPRPNDEAIIYRHFAALHEGFVTYSEGVNDDVNKFLWTQWGWDSATPADTILQDYARFFIGPQGTKAFAQGIVDLEENWRGPILNHPQIARTLGEFQAIEHSPNAPQQNWRFEMALYRAYYDAFLQTRLSEETHQQTMALEALKQAPKIGASAAMLQAEALLQPPSGGPDAALRDRVFALGGDLFHHVGLQLSTRLYGAANWERGANLDRIDIPLNDRVWLGREFARIRQLPASEQEEAVAQIAAWSAPATGVLYDDLGNPALEPHLVRGPGFAEDPEFYQSAIDGVSDHTPAEGLRWSQLTYAEALYETPLRLHYSGLDPARHYRLRVVYGGEDYALPLRLTANRNLEIHPALQRTSNPQTLQFDLPAEATRTGTLDLEWTRPGNLGGSGRGRQITEVWLVPESKGPGPTE